MLSGYLVGDKELVRTVANMGPQVKAEVDRSVQRLGFALEARVKQAYLRGPRPTHLGVRTSRLITSITANSPGSRSRFVSTPVEAIYYVGTNVSYGALWEYGFKQKIGAGARGGPRTLQGAARDRYFSKHPPGIKNVPPRPFLSPALADLRQRVVDEMAAALQRGMLNALRGR